MLANQYKPSYGVVVSSDWEQRMELKGQIDFSLPQILALKILPCAKWRIWEKRRWWLFLQMWSHV